MNREMQEAVTVGTVPTCTSRLGSLFHGNQCDQGGQISRQFTDLLSGASTGALNKTLWRASQVDLCVPSATEVTKVIHIHKSHKRARPDGLPLSFSRSGGQFSTTEVKPMGSS